MRRRLFGDKKTEGSKPIELNIVSSSTRSEDVKLLSKEEVEHENLANELLRLTTSMKKQYQVSGAVIREDNAVFINNF